MVRIAILAALMVTGAAAAETKSERAERCATQGHIVDLAVAMRSDNTREKRARRSILKDGIIAGTSHEPIVEVLVSWVYTLPEDQLTPEATVAFVDACTAFEQ